ncbi:putative multidrug resistance-associated protein [Triangularia verruculosa]|uniref:Multidrug resistance-associated protein n=1 Tax=Triangularia verruculosa TaxID=2587418 RepID=A0AAN6XQI6_9PEZI|nr:putative multidrug resistance-associated protein [Triangularia verruculosa]
MEFTGCIDDESFGPSVRGCRGDFDFTLKFEKIFFAIIPSIIFIALSLPSIIQLYRKPYIVEGAILRYSKLLAISIYSIFQIGQLALSIAKSRRLGVYFIPADALTFASSICMIILSFLEHSKSPRPSILLNAYLFIAILLDISQTRTIWLASTNDDEYNYARIFTVGVAIRALLVVLESQSKSRSILQWDNKAHSPEETSGLYGLSAYFWLNKLFLRGYRGVLTLDDLFPLDHNISSDKLWARAGHSIGAAELGRRKHGLAKAVVKAFAVFYLRPIGPRLALGAFQFCQPFLIETLLNYLEQPVDNSPKNIGYGLIGAGLLIYVGMAVSAALYWYFQERAMYMTRGLLAAAVYRKTTAAKISAADDSAALTLMSADIERVLAGCLEMHEFWANMIEVAFACWLLSRKIGVAFLAPVLIVGVCVIFSFFLAKAAGPTQKAWMERIQKRVGLTTNMIAQVKHLKISGLSTPMEGSIQAMRVDELNAGAKFRIIQVYAAIVGYTPLFLSPVITFAFASRTLDVTTIFTSISYILLLANPLGSLFQHLPSFLAALTCLNRIQTFLEQDARLDFRESWMSPHCDGSSEGSKPSSDHVALDDTPSLKITNGKFGWDDDKTALHNIDIHIPRSGLTIVVGPVASGKSTFCKALLGEVPVYGGRLLMASHFRKIGYCDQNPYLANATIRENIIGISAFDQNRFDEVIEATMLRQDLALLPQGDETNVGSNGITLSGGQKQRVSMARALYAETEFLVFDDILSGLDADTEEQVFRRVFAADGLLRRRGATTVLCTHSIRHLPSANHIVALGSDGSIVEQGTFQELMSNDNYVQSLGVQEADASSSANDSIPQEKAGLVKVPTISPTEATAFSPEADKTRATGDFAVYRHYFARLNIPGVIALIIAAINWGFCLNFATIWLKFWSEDVVSPQPRHSNAFYNGLYALFQLGALTSLYISARVVFTTMINVSGAKLHLETLRTVINAPLKFFTTTDTGVVTNLFSQDMTLIDGQLPMALVNLVLYIFNCLGMAAVVATASPYLAAAYPFLAAVLYVIQKFYLRTSRQIRLLDLEAKSPLYSHFIDTIKGIATYRAFGWIPESIKKNNALLDTSQRPAYLLAMIQRWLAFTMQMVVAVLAVAVITLSTQMRSNTAFTGASLVTLMIFGEAFSYIIRFYTMLETSIGAVSRLKAFGETVKSENREGEDLMPAEDWPSKGEIKIEGVSASYSGQDESHTKPNEEAQNLALKDLNLHINSGEKVAICGRSGSGKSSLILLLLRLLDPTPSPNSSIEIDSLTLTKIHRSTLRQRIIAVPQDPVFLPDGTSFQANLDPLGLASEEECRSVLEVVSLWQSFVAERGGLQAPMSSDTLSQGQKQLFSMARAILRRRIRARGSEKEKEGGLLLLDEVSSSVDKDTDAAMQRIILDEFAAYTIVMVSHRLGMVMNFDRVIVMDEGRIVEDGTPKGLVEQEGSRFRDLWMIGRKKRN